jgi:hypothetical protein
MKRRKRRKSRNKQIFFLIIGIEVLLLICGLAYVQLRPLVVKAVTIEAGEKALNVEEFLLYKNRKGSFITNVQDMNLTAPGIYEIKIKVGKRIQTSNLEIVDTIPPKAIVINQVALREETIEASNFVTEITDATEVTVSYLKAPDTKLLGDQEVTILLEDSGNNFIEKTAMLTVLDMKNSVTLEAGSKMDITVNDFVDNDKYEIAFVTDLTTLDISVPVEHKIQINVNGRIVTGSIEIKDTISPTATIINQEIWKGEKPSAETFVTDIKDASEVKVSYKETPDFTKSGEQEVVIELEDGSSNRAQLKALCTIKEDLEPPVINGVADKTVYIGDAISYKKGVSVEDNKDEDLAFTVDSGKVNLKKEGNYSVTYSAFDKAGNKTTKKITITVKKFLISEETLYEQADVVLTKIVKDSMTNREVAHEIYKWIKQHISYTGTSDKSDWMAEAYRGMKNGVGDCFTYYAVAEALLTRADIDNMRVTRVGGTTKHFWNLVNCGDGWYHFDSCPNRDHKDSFMLTDDEVAELTKLRGKNYYIFDKTLYPETPKK